MIPAFFGPHICIRVILSSDPKCHISYTLTLIWVMVGVNFGLTKNVVILIHTLNVNSLHGRQTIQSAVCLLPSYLFTISKPQYRSYTTCPAGYTVQRTRYGGGKSEFLLANTMMTPWHGHNFLVTRPFSGESIGNHGVSNHWFLYCLFNSVFS